MLLQPGWTAVLVAMLLFSNAAADTSAQTQPEGRGDLQIVTQGLPAALNSADPVSIELSRPSSAGQWLYTLRWWALGVAVLALLRWTQSKGTVSALIATIGLLVVGMSFVFGRPPAPQTITTEQVGAVVKVPPQAQGSG